MKFGPFSIRALAYYVIAAAGGAVYGGQVCPLMERLPAWTLGLVILAPLVLAYGLRGVLSARLVDKAPTHRQSRRQFFLELALMLGSGLASMLILYQVYRFPFLGSGLRLLLGLSSVALFAALDLALARERSIIGESRPDRITYAPPKRFYPITRSFFLASTLVLASTASILILVLVRDMNLLAVEGLTGNAIVELNQTVTTEITMVMGFLLLMVVNLVHSYSRNLRRLFRNQTEVLENVSRGDLSRQVPVATSNELGVIAGHTNTMIGSLREGVRMREGLLIASEVQHHFLPDHAPDLPGLEMAGTARFSDETGGDFFDFIECEQPGCTLYGVMVGDVSGHGIGSALLMAAGRALVRQSASLPAPLSQRIGVANRHLVRDVGDSGHFITLFFLEMDPRRHTGSWVNAGHQPPLFYDPVTDSFKDLKGEDIPLGVEPGWMFHEHVLTLPGPGQILVLSTDGVPEAMNKEGEMFGEGRFREAVRLAADRGAQEIIREVVRAVTEFTGRTSQEDDLTLVVIKGTAAD
jgi:sigma-B regulation protein RsbU (phosphoserine phosphatase)